jgi:glycosyltransferase involved in cell wall biosynthesis
MAKLKNMRKAVLITNIPNNYRIPLFNELSKQLLEKEIELHVIFGARNYSRRKSNIDLNDIQFKYSFLDSSLYEGSNDEKIVFGYNKLTSVLKAISPTVIICGGFSPATVKVFLYTFFKNVSYIIWSGSITDPQNKTSLIRTIQRKVLVKFAKAFIAYGTKAKLYLEDLGANPEKIKIGINTVDTDFYISETEKLRHQKVTTTEKRLLCIGYLVKRKNISTLIESLQSTLVNNNDLFLDIIGDGEDRVNLEKLVAEKGLTSKVIFHGFKQRDELPKFMANSYAFLFQTDFDIWGLTLNEAMSAGLPCLSSINAGATIDLIEDNKNGFCVNFYNKTNVEQIVNKLVNDVKYADQIGKAAKTTIIEKASIEKSAKGFTEAITLAVNNEL